MLAPSEAVGDLGLEEGEEVIAGLCITIRRHALLMKVLDFFPQFFEDEIIASAHELFAEFVVCEHQQLMMILRNDIHERFWLAARGGGGMGRRRRRRRRGSQLFCHFLHRGEG